VSGWTRGALIVGVFRNPPLQWETPKRGLCLVWSRNIDLSIPGNGNLGSQ
jgi:hypothetical protein